jgi:ABC-type enterochelin transport system permease subunit
MPKFLQQIKQWWQTDCAFCRRSRYILLWALIMLVFYLYVWN